MQRRQFVKNSALTFLSLAVLNKYTLASFLNNPAYNIKMLTDTIGVFTEKGGTILFMLNTDGPVIVDAQFPDSANHLIEELNKRSSLPFRLLINTHHHMDHTAGNISFKGLVPHVLAHENSKTNQQNVAIKNKSEDKQLYPDQTYSDVWSEKIGKETFALHYFGAGHTDGDSVVQLMNSNIIHMGDLVFNRRHPYVDKTAGANISSWINVLDKTTKTFSNKTTYVCGHAGDGYDIVLKKDDVLAFKDYLTNVMKYTEAQIKAGKTKDEILKVTEIPGSPDWKGDGIERPLTAAYIELTTK
ncbi:MAG: MBL fold metallo-hydrolase [Bacteroidetes bacterium]|nr:MBL fold metallo-hydrolase [Bacteroidota bacterium]MBS1756654.1 MBL fold metallo-hydrolase [Bacteroidota bacterium]